MYFGLFKEFGKIKIQFFFFLNLPTLVKSKKTKYSLIQIEVLPKTSTKKPSKPFPKS